MGVEEVGGKRCLEPCGRKKARRVEDQGVKRPIRGRGGLGQRCGQIGEYVSMAIWLFRGEYIHHVCTHIQMYVQEVQ